MAKKLNGKEIIDALREIVNNRTMGSVNGVKVDVQSANMVLKLYESLNEKNKAKLLTFDIAKMISIANKLL